MSYFEVISSLQNICKHTRNSCVPFVWVCLCARAQVLSHVQLFVTALTVAHHAPLSMEFCRQEYWSGLPFPSLGRLRNQTCVSCIPGRFFTTKPPGTLYLDSIIMQFALLVWSYFIYLHMRSFSLSHLRVNWKHQASRISKYSSGNFLRIIAFSFIVKMRNLNVNMILLSKPQSIFQILSVISIMFFIAFLPILG